VWIETVGSLSMKAHPVSQSIPLPTIQEGWSFVANWNLLTS